MLDTMFKCTLFPRIVCVALTLVCCAGAGIARAADSPEILARKTHEIFAAKCFSCHAPTAKKVKKFGYIDDFAKVRGNSKLLVPGNLVESPIFTSIEEGEMPPDDSDIPQLTDEEKGVVRAWIEAGAPPGDTAPLAAATAPTTGPTTASSVAAGKAPPPLSRRTVRFLGKFHPLVAHFPIALLVTAALAEILCFRYRSHQLTGAVRFCTVFGAAGALGSAALGWINANYHSSSDLLETHRWIGAGAALWAIPVALLCEWGARRAHRSGEELWRGASRFAFRCALFLGVTLIGVAAHMGGALVYGEDYFKF